MMATCFNRGSEVQADNLQKLYVMNPSYADEHQPLLLNQGTVHNAPHHLVGIPLAHSGSGSPGADISRQSSFHEIPSSAAAGNRFQYNLWGGAGPSSTTNSVSDLGAPMGFRRQGLSLSLNNSSPAPTSSASGSSQSVILGSKYLKAAQQLLDEVVNVADSGAGGAHREKEKAAVLKSDEEKGGCEALSSAQRQELQMKKAKLLHMLDEVEQRYKQYEMQMQRLGWALEHAAGAGTAKSYTWLALRTMSKQFRYLQDAIASQVKETGRRLGEEEEDGPPSTSNGRLRMVERQRAMQQLGVMHSPHNAWRPQRGLPERAVSLLRAWLFEHFLHPYPKDSDKHMLAKQTGLTRSQVSNWFINARVRLWKPMVEEMYVEEMKGAARRQTADCDDANDNDNDDTNKESTLAPKSTTPLQSINQVSNPNSPNNSINDIPKSTLISPRLGSTGPGFSLIGSSSSGMESSILIQRSPKRQRNSIFFTTPDGRFGPNGYPVGDPIGSRLNPDHHHQLGQIRYHHHAGNAVSLTLGLPHGENLLSLSGAHHPQQNFLSGQSMQLGRRLDVGEPEWCPARPGPHSGGYEGGVDIQTRKRFAAPLLPDFVA